MAKATRVVAAVVAGALLLGSGAAHAAAPTKKKKKPPATTTTIATQEDTSTLRSTLTVSACSLSLDDEAKLAPLATGTVGTIAFEGGRVSAVSLPNPVPVEIAENGNRVTCTYKAGSDSNPVEDNVVIDAVDFPGSTGVDAAKRAYTTVKAAYQPAKLGAARPAGPPEDLTGLGDEAFVAKRDDGNAQAFVTRQGEILVRVDASQSSSTVSAPLDFDAVRAVTAIVLAKAVAQVPTSSGSGSSTTTGTNPKGNTGTGQITTTGAINATWGLRIADLGISAGCGIIPIITKDGTITGSINATLLGDVHFETSKFTEALNGKGATLQVPTDGGAAHPPYHVTFDATVKDQFTGKKKTTIKGAFDFTCTDQ